MGDDEGLAPSEDGLTERGRTYDHDIHGQVEATGIWQGVQEVDEACNTNEKVVIIVRYSYEREEGGRVEELTDTLPEFLEVIIGHGNAAKRPRPRRNRLAIRDGMAQTD